MRILAAADIHGDYQTYQWLTETARHHVVELVVLAGDLLGDAETYDEIEAAQRADAIRIITILGAISVPVYYIMGNDDWIDLDPPDRRCRSLHMNRIDHECFNFVGYQYSLPFMGGVNERPEEAIALDMGSLESLLDDHTVLVTHSPAAGVLDSTVLGPAGSPSIRASILRRGVTAHIHGHVHAQFGRDGRHFNVAAARRRRAVLIDLDTLRHEVVEDQAVR